MKRDVNYISQPHLLVPNSVHEQITKHYLQQSQFGWESQSDVPIHSIQHNFFVNAFFMERNTFTIIQNNIAARRYVNRIATTR